MSTCSFEIELDLSLLDPVELGKYLEDISGTRFNVLGDGGVSLRLRERIHADTIRLWTTTGPPTSSPTPLETASIHAALNLSSRLRDAAWEGRYLAG
jgi:hypothetical protein